MPAKWTGQRVPHVRERKSGTEKGWGPGRATVRGAAAKGLGRWGERREETGG